jgi:hypothetical protein
MPEFDSFEFLSEELSIEKEDDHYYSQAEIDDIISEKIYHVCTDTSQYIKSYCRENALPFAENFNYHAIYDFITHTGKDV